MPYSREEIEAIIRQATDAAAERAVNETIEYAEKRHREIQARLDKHEHTLYGNGREGIVTKLDRIERAVAGWEAIGRRVLETVITAAVIGLLILIVQAGLFKP